MRHFLLLFVFVLVFQLAAANRISVFQKVDGEFKKLDNVFQRIEFRPGDTFWLEQEGGGVQPCLQLQGDNPFMTVETVIDGKSGIMVFDQLPFSDEWKPVELVGGAVTYKYDMEIYVEENLIKIVLTKTENDETGYLYEGTGVNKKAALEEALGAAFSSGLSPKTWELVHSKFNPSTGLMEVKVKIAS